MVTLDVKKKKKSVFHPCLILGYRLLLRMNYSNLLHSVASLSQLFTECNGFMSRLLNSINRWQTQFIGVSM